LILDTSPIVAIAREEEGFERLIEAIESAAHLGIGTATAMEATIVLVRRFGVVGRLILARFLEENEVIYIPFDDRHLSVAADAFLRFGKGRHPAALNYGDCMAYATAKVAGAPLLFTGEDFARTDIAAV
jgi:ribonuclease VapC